MNCGVELISRPMEESDLEDVMEIERASFSSPWSREMYVSELSNRSSRAVVFFSDDVMAGYFCMWVVLDEAHIMNIAVRPGFRRLGVGKAIMDHIERIALKERLRRILLEVARNNKAGRALYKKCGFSSIGFRKKYYSDVNDDALVMDKWIGGNSPEPPTPDE